jgi:shikimate dehydrogenase
MTPYYAVFGQPIAHSLSPRIHAAFGEQVGIRIDYRAIEAGRADFPRALEAFAASGGRGANVTLPLKEDAAAACVSLSDRARRCGSVNTLIRDGDGWRGDSTDGAGLLGDLRRRHGFDPQGRLILLLGAGGAGRAAAFALAEAGAQDLVIANRTHERAEALAGALPAARAIAWGDLAQAGAFDLVVNATAAGHAGTGFVLPPALFADASALAYDLSYGPAAQPFLAAAREAGAARAVDGLGMLVEQAAEAFALWHKRRPDTDAVYAALRR